MTRLLTIIVALLVSNCAFAQPLPLPPSSGGGGGGTQYTEGDTDSTPTGNVVMWRDGTDAIVSATEAAPLPVQCIQPSYSNLNVQAFSEASSTFYAGVEGLHSVGEEYVSTLRPVSIGGVASSTTPSAVSAGDAVGIWIDLNGRIQIGDGGGSLTVDGTVGATQSGTWNIGTVSTITNVVHIDDNGGSVTVDGGVTCNAGTNLNTSALATSANQSTMITALQLIDDPVITDDAAFTPATNKVSMAGFEADETATDSVDEGDAGAARMTLDRKQIIALYAHAAGGADGYSFLSTSAVQTAQIKGSPGNVYDIECFNVGSSAAFIRLYDQTGSPANTDTANIKWRGTIPAATTGAGHVVPFVVGRFFGTGIGIRVTAAIADNDATALTASQVMCNVGYK